MAKKLVLIGAGSAEFTQGLLMDMIAEEWTEPWELGLVDIEPTVLNAMARLCGKMIAEKNRDIGLTVSTDRRELLPGADFVVSTIGVGGRRAWEQDVFIPREFGIYQPVGDSVAPGGISRAMRMIPALVGVANDIKQLCPNAFFFNYSNPNTTVCMAVRKATGFPVIGLCHGVKGGLRRLARYMDVPMGELSCRVVGLNHFVILYKLYRDGKDVFPLFLETLDRGKGDPDSDIGPLSEEFFRLYKGYPVSDDRHYSEFTQSYFGEGGYFGKTLGVDAYSFEHTIERGDAEYTQTLELAMADGPLPPSFWEKLEGEHEDLMRIIQSILHDKREIFEVNMPNEGSVLSLPADAVLEMPAAATADGFLPFRIYDFPARFSGMLSKHISIGQLTVDAAIHGDRALYEEAIWQGGYMKDRSAVRKMTGRLIEAHKQYLPGI